MMLSFSPPQGRPGRRACTLAVLFGLLSAPTLASTPFPLVDGVYCGPGDKIISVDSARNTITIEGAACAFPIIGADKLQSARCSGNGRHDERRIFDFRLLNGQILHDGRWYALCRALPAGG